MWLKGFGGPEVLVAGEAQDPVAGPGQALIEVAFAGVTFVEARFRASGLGPYEAELPMIPGNGVGGVVASVGAGVDDGLVGERVVSSTGGSGGYAELVAVDAGGLIGVPEGLALVEAAAGGVGTLLDQLARAAGARVVAAAGGPRKLELALGLGAEIAVDYREPAWTDRVREAVGSVDVVFDGVGGATGRSAFGLLRRGGRMLSFGLASGERADVSEEAAAERGVTKVRMPRPTPEEMRAFTGKALAEAAAGR